MEDSPDILVAKLRQGNVRALARVISLIEDNHTSARKCVELLYPHTGRAQVIGITGAPGAGKSTLVDQIASHLVDSGKKVAILAVDPSSPFSGGALLGDRIRMAKALSRRGVFVRSMATRGALGGIAPTTSETIYALDAAGFDYVLVETVGVGQGEVEIVRTSDTCAVVLVPGMGDGVQTLKAGILEIADVLVINKADHQGADQLRSELREMVGLANNKDWEPQAVCTVATTGDGIPELIKAMFDYRDWASKSGRAEERRAIFLKETLFRQIAAQLLDELKDFAEKRGLISSTLKELTARKTDPISAAEKLTTRFKVGQ